VNQRLGYLVRSGEPDAMDSIAPMAFGNLALDLILEGISGRLVNVRDGVYGSVPLDVVKGPARRVEVERFYKSERLRPDYRSFDGLPVLIMTGQDT